MTVREIKQQIGYRNTQQADKENISMVKRCEHCQYGTATAAWIIGFKCTMYSFSPAAMGTCNSQVRRGGE